MTKIPVTILLARKPLITTPLYHLVGYCLAGLGIALLDQALKHYISGLLPLCWLGQCESIELLPFFKLTVLHNTGAAFSFLHDAGGWQRWFLVVVSSGVSLFILVWLARLGRGRTLLALALAVILGGALGNLWDRAAQGYVVDFIVLHYAGYYFPAFNLADTAITVGVALYLLDMLLSRNAPNKARDQAE